MDRPAVAIVTNSCPPYRLHVHQRIVREIPQIKLFSPFTHERSDGAWAFRNSDDIGGISFGQNESVLEHRPFHEWKKGGRIIEWFKQNNIRAVVVSGYSDPGRLRMIRWCRRHGIACLFHGDSNIRGDVVTGWRAAVKRRLVNWVTRSVDAVLVCGSLGREYFLKYGARPEQIFYYPYEPDYSLIQNIPESTLQAAKERFNLKPTRRRIVYSGRLIPVKRVDMLIDAFAAIAAERPEWDLLIVGDGVLRDQLKSRVPAHLNDRIQWTGFLDDQPAISAIYRLSDVLVLPSENEPWAVVINEAVAAGMAIVASDVVGAAAELVEDSVNGKIVPSQNLDALTRALRDVTDISLIDALKAGSARKLAEWQAEADPIAGLRKALIQCRVISDPANP